MMMSTAYRTRRLVLGSPIRILLLLVLFLAIIAWQLRPPLYPPNDEVFQPERKIDGFTLVLADPDSLVEYDFSHGPLEPLYLIGERGFRWITFNGRTYQGHFADHGMFYREEYLPENSIVVREETRRQQNPKWPTLREVTISDSSTSAVLGRAERWYGKNWRIHPIQKRNSLGAFLAKAFKRDPSSAFTVVPITVMANDIHELRSVANVALDSRPPEFDNCGDDVGVAAYGHTFGVTTPTWDYFSLGWMEYVYCRNDQIFIVLSDGMPHTRVFDLVWLGKDGSFRGRFRRDLRLSETLRAPFWVESFDFSDGKITVDRRSGFRCDHESYKESSNEQCRVRSAIIEIDTATANENGPFVSESFAAHIRAVH